MEFILCGMLRCCLSSSLKLFVELGVHHGEHEEIDEPYQKQRGAESKRSRYCS